MGRASLIKYQQITNLQKTNGNWKFSDLKKFLDDEDLNRFKKKKPSPTAIALVLLLSHFEDTQSQWQVTMDKGAKALKKEAGKKTKIQVRKANKVLGTNVQYSDIFF